MTAEIRNDVIVATEHIKAPPEVVFPYFTDAALIVEWIGNLAELDPQPGGVFSLDMGEVVARGAYLAVEPPYRVVFSWGTATAGSTSSGGCSLRPADSPSNGTSRSRRARRSRRSHRTTRSSGSRRCSRSSDSAMISQVTCLIPQEDDRGIAFVPEHRHGRRGQGKVSSGRHV